MKDDDVWMLRDPNGNVKVTVLLPDHWMGIGSERCWAKPVGEDVYEIQNVLFYAYGVHLHDRVRATPSEEGRLVVREIVQPSGHLTVRLAFHRICSGDCDREHAHEYTPLTEQTRCLELIKSSHSTVEFERATEGLVAMSIPPHADHPALRKTLDSFEEVGLLHWESGKQREPNSFSYRGPEEG